MGQKVNPHGLRVGVIKEWDSKWYAEKDFADNLVEDHEIRTFLKKRLYSAGISSSWSSSLVLFCMASEGECSQIVIIHVSFHFFLLLCHPFPKL